MGFGGLHFGVFPLLSRGSPTSAPGHALLALPAAAAARLHRQIGSALLLPGKALAPFGDAALAAAGRPFGQFLCRRRQALSRPSRGAWGARGGGDSKWGIRAWCEGPASSVAAARCLPLPSLHLHCSHRPLQHAKASRRGLVAGALRDP